MKKSIVIVGIAVVAIAVARVSFAVDKGVIWTPGQVSETAVSGKASTSTTVSFVSDKSLNQVTVQIDPSLQPYLSVTPSSLVRVNKDQPVTLTLSFAVGSTTPPQDVSGEITLFKDNWAQKVLGTLPAMIHIEWPSIRTDTVIFSYPPSLIASGAQVEDPIIEQRSSDTESIGIPVAAPGQDSVVTFGLLVHQSPNRLSIQDWFTSAIDPTGSLLSSHTFEFISFADGRQALILSAPLPDTYDGPPVSYAYIRSPQGSRIVSIELSQDNDLELLGFTTPTARGALLRSIVEQMKITD